MMVDAHRRSLVGLPEGAADAAGTVAAAARRGRSPAPPLLIMAAAIGPRGRAWGVGVGGGRHEW